MNDLLAKSAVVACVAFCASTALAQNAYRQVNLVANQPEFGAQILDSKIGNGWGIAIRPPGAGGHFWINNAATGTSTTYVGDVPGVPLYQDELPLVDVPSSALYAGAPGTVSQPTGIVYTGSTSTEFMVTGEGITGPSKFVFVALDGSISAWTTGQRASVNMIDHSGDGAMYTGVAVTDFKSGNRLYVTEFNARQRVEVYDGAWKPVKVAGDFRDPATNEQCAIYNLQYMNGKLYAAWAHVGDDPGEEDRFPGYGHISVFDLEGRLLQSFEHRLELNAPWGMAIAPANFGAMSNRLLVANFGDGEILAYDLTTGRYIDQLRDPAGKPIQCDGIWGLTFGNGVRLGHANHLYFAAGPNNEEDGLFAKLVPVTTNRADVDASGSVDFADLRAFASGWLKRSLSADIDANGVVNAGDAAGYLARWILSHRPHDSAVASHESR